MAALPYIQLYVADYLADTAHLTTEENGAYLLLIFNYWQRGKALNNANDRLATICRLGKEAWERIKPALIEFFDIDGDTWTHPRLEKDLQRVSGKDPSDTRLTDEWRGYVYFIVNQSASKVKIGYSKNPWARVKDLQVGNSDQLLLAAMVRTTDPSEKKLHAELEEYRVGGEWFEMSSLIDALIKAAQSKAIDTLDDAINYCRNYGTTTVVTTKDTDTDLYTDKSLCTSKEVLVLAGEDDGCRSPIKRIDREQIPVRQIVDLYHEMLPELRHVDKITSARRSHIQQRWRDDLPTLDAWRNYFLDVANTPFLLGRGPPRSNGKPWRADLEWLCKEGNFAKVSEGKYKS